MITVTLGTIPYPFKRLIDWLSILTSEGFINEPVYLQHGNTDIEVLKNNQLISSVSTVSKADLIEEINASRLVISHAGQGSTRMLAKRTTSFIIVPRLSEYGEHVDNHQLLFSQSVVQLGVSVCDSLEGLKLAIKHPPTPLNRDIFEGDKLANYLSQRYSKPSHFSNRQHR